MDQKEANRNRHARAARAAGGTLIHDIPPYHTLSKPAAGVLRHLSAGSWTVWGDAPTVRVGSPKKLTAP